MSIATFDADVVIDGTDCILGRVATQVAERALAGDRVAVVNAERMIITGRKEDVFSRFKDRTAVGSDRGPDYPLRPDRIVKRSIRGMIPHKRPRGQDAFERIRVYVGNPYEEDGEILEDTTLDRLSNIRFVELGEVSEHLGANVTW